MGMFDYVKCEHSLPWPEATEVEWQTKSTDLPYLDNYELRADGTLWQKKYTLRTEVNHAAPLGFYQHRDNPHWIQVPWTGEFEIHGCTGDWWYDVRFWFRDGVVKDIATERRPLRK